MYFYRDKNDLECDAIVHLRDGRWGAIEIKLGSKDSIEAAAKNLLKFVSVVDTDEMNKASYVYSKVKDAIDNNKQYIILYDEDLKSDNDIIINVDSITDIVVEYYEE